MRYRSAANRPASSPPVPARISTTAARSASGSFGSSRLRSSPPAVPPLPPAPAPPPPPAPPAPRSSPAARCCSSDRCVRTRSSRSAASTTGVSSACSCATFRSRSGPQHRRVRQLIRQVRGAAGAAARRATPSSYRPPHSERAGEPPALLMLRPSSFPISGGTARPGRRYRSASGAPCRTDGRSRRSRRECPSPCSASRTVAAGAVDLRRIVVRVNALLHGSLSPRGRLTDR
jgi:hypothetical protein